jgi:hypothetical protein
MAVRSRTTKPKKPAAASAPPAPPADEPRKTKAHEPKSGELVTFTYQDAAGADVVRTGLVVRVTDEHDPGGNLGAVVAWLSEFSDPIPFDQLAQVQ